MMIDQIEALVLLYQTVSKCNHANTKKITQKLNDVLPVIVLEILTEKFKWESSIQG